MSYGGERSGGAGRDRDGGGRDGGLAKRAGKA